MEINGKIYRNLEGQVGYLTEKYDDLQDQINDVKGKLTHYIIVEELPTEDIDTSAVYLVGPKGTEPDTYYEEWVYVETSSGTWSWEKLGDTASVDLSGYLEKVTTATTYQQVYGKYTDGGQLMMNAAVGQVGNALVQRNASGQIYVPATPTEYDHAASKQYADNNFVAKRTDVTTNYYAYCKASDGSQTTLECTGGGGAGKLALYVGNGNINVGDPTSDSQAVNRGYADGRYVGKVSTVTTYRQVYAKNPDGSQYMQVVNGKDFDAGVDRIACFGTDGRLRVGEPVNAKDAATKGYVDAAVGQLLYLHDIDLTITVDSTNKLFIKAYLVNGSGTAITSFDRIVYKRIDVQWGGFGPTSDNAVPAAITKMPDNFRQDDFEEPLIGFLYQYFSGGNLVSAQTNSSMTTTITDVVISF